MAITAFTGLSGLSGLAGVFEIAAFVASPSGGLTESGAADASTAHSFLSPPPPPKQPPPKQAI